MEALKWFLIGWMSGGFAMGALMFLDLRRRFLAEGPAESSEPEQSSPVTRTLPIEGTQE